MRGDGLRLTPIDGGLKAVFQPPTLVCRTCHGIGRVENPVEKIIADLRAPR